MCNFGWYELVNVYTNKQIWPCMRNIVWLYMGYNLHQMHIYLGLPHDPDIQQTSLAKVSAKHQKLSPGGEWESTSCEQRYPIAIIIPFRNRTEQLAVLMNNLHDFLQRQNAHYHIFVVEQVWAGTGRPLFSIIYSKYLDITLSQVYSIISGADN